MGPIFAAGNGYDAVSATDGDFWVFAYGSLMWRPGFEYVEARSALLHGYHREFCVYSHRHRGTPQKPGLVLGLDRGGCCRGLAFRVAAAEVEAVMRYLAEREMVNNTYEPRTVPAETEVGRLPVYAFVVRRDHPQYAGKLAVAEAAALIVQGEGISGLNRDYLINTVRRLESLGFIDKRLHALLTEVKRMTGEIERGSGI
jgi:cation transport protein ChaC